MDPISTARYGMMAATQQLTASANRVAANGVNGDYPAEAVGQIQANQSFTANADVIKVADQMWHSLLDLQAR